MSVSPAVAAENDRRAAAVRQDTPDTSAAEALGLTLSVDDVPYQTAVAAHARTSWTPEKRGDEDRREYVRHINGLAERLTRFVESDDDRTRLAAELERHRQGYLRRLRAQLDARARTASAAVVGPARFPTQRNRKAQAVEQRKLEALVTYQKGAFRRLANKIWPKHISSDRDDAVEALEAKIADAEKLHETMKKANAVVRRKSASRAAKLAGLEALGIKGRAGEALLEADYAGRAGFAGYQLTNNKANIRRMRERLAELQREKATPSTRRRFVDVPGLGQVDVEDSAEANRIRLYFDGKPAADARHKLKKNGFRWAPSVGAWQRHRNDSTRSTLRYSFGIDLDGPVEPSGPPKAPAGQDAEPDWAVQLAEVAADHVDLPSGRALDLSEAPWRARRKALIRLVELGRAAADSKAVARYQRQLDEMGGKANDDHSKRHHYARRAGASGERAVHHDPMGPRVPLRRGDLRYGIRRAAGYGVGHTYSVFDFEAGHVVDTPPGMGTITSEPLAWQAADAWNEAAARGSTPLQDDLAETRRRWLAKAAELADGTKPGALGHWLRAIRQDIKATEGNDPHQNARGKVIEAILVAERDRRTAERREARKADRAQTKAVAQPKQAHRRSASKASQASPKAQRKKRTSTRKRGTPVQRELLCLVQGQVFTADELARAACYRGTKRAESMLGRMEANGLVVRDGDGWRKTAAPQVCSMKGPDRQTDDRARESWKGDIGPAGTVYDAEGRPYPIRWRALPMSVIRASNHPDGRKVEGYPGELQARDRGAGTSLEQVKRIAADLDPGRLLAPSTAATDSAPIVWPGADGQWFVVSGNGRTMALQLVDRQTRRAYLDAARAELPGVEIPRGGIVVREMVGATFDQAVQFAGASQAAAAAALSPLEQARSVARGVGVRTVSDLLGLGPLRWTGTLRADDWRRFAEANSRWSSALLSRVEATRRPTVAGDPHEAAMLAVDTLIGALPDDVVRGGLGDRGAEEALRGALPGIWSLEHAIRHQSLSAQTIGPEWSLLMVLPDARRLYTIAGRKGISALRRDVAESAGQEAMDFHGQALPELGSLDRLGVALGVALLRAGRRKDPQAAAADYLTDYIEKARAAALVVGDMFADPIHPDAALGEIVRWADPRPRAA